VTRLYTIAYMRKIFEERPQLYVKVLIIYNWAYRNTSYSALLQHYGARWWPKHQCGCLSVMVMHLGQMGIHLPRCGVHGAFGRCAFCAVTWRVLTVQLRYWQHQAHHHQACVSVFTVWVHGWHTHKRTHRVCSILSGLLLSIVKQGIFLTSYHRWLYRSQ